jgi:hypothetical protein
MDIGAMIFGVVVLFAGIFYVLRNTLGFNLGELNWDLIWPVLVVVLGASIIYRAVARPPSA